MTPYYKVYFHFIYAQLKSRGHAEWVNDYLQQQSKLSYHRYRDVPRTFNKSIPKLVPGTTTDLEKSPV